MAETAFCRTTAKAGNRRWFGIVFLERDHRKGATGQCQAAIRWRFHSECGTTPAHRATFRSAHGPACARQCGEQAIAELKTRAARPSPDALPSPRSPVSFRLFTTRCRSQEIHRHITAAAERGLEFFQGEEYFAVVIARIILGFDVYGTDQAAVCPALNSLLRGRGCDRSEIRRARAQRICAGFHAAQ